MAASRSSSPSFRSMNLSPSSLFKAIIILGACIIAFSYAFWGRLATVPNFIHRKPIPSSDFPYDSPAGQDWTHRIWQTSKDPVVDLEDEKKDRVKTWSDLNPEYRHEVLTDEMMESYVKDHFHVSNPDFEEIYFQVKDYIVRSDLIRYLILLSDGGVYNDLDVGCEKPIKEWVPSQFKEDAGVVLGVEVDNKYGPDGRTWTGGTDLFQLVNWTIMSKPNQPFMSFLVERVMNNLKDMAASLGKPLSKVTFTIQNVLDVTGPAALTQAFFDYASDITSTNVTYQNFTKMTKPRLIGEVVILPIQAFGAGHQVEWAGMEPANGQELIHHYFAGSWKTDHVDNPPHLPSADGEGEGDVEDGDEEEETEEEEDPSEAEERKKKAEEERKKQEAAAKEAEDKKEEESAGENKSQQGAATSTTAADAPSDTPVVTIAESTAGEDFSGSKEKEEADSDKPDSVKYMEDQTKEGQSTDAAATDKPESVMDMINANKAAAAAANSTTSTASTKSTEEEAEAEKQAKEKAKHDKEIEKAKIAAEARKKAIAAVEAKKKEAEEKAKEEASKPPPKTKEEIEEEQRKAAWEEVKKAAPEWAPKKAGGELKASNDLADYDVELD